MMINFELTPGLRQAQKMARQVAETLLRPISRKYDLAEHEAPVELEPLGQMMTAQRRSARERPSEADAAGAKRGAENGVNLTTVVSMIEMCRGDAGLVLSIPGMGLGNAAIEAVGTEEQRARFGSFYAAMAITEPSAGSDSAAISTTARLDGDAWVINGEKIFVTSGGRCTAVVVWATLDRSKGKSAIRSFVVEKGTPGMEVLRLDHKLGIRASDTATIAFTDCRIPRANLLGSSDIATDPTAAFGGVMQTFDNTRPLVGAMAVGVARGSLDLAYQLLAKHGIAPAYDQPLWRSTAIEAELYRLEASWESARLLVIKAAWMADNRQPNSLHASMAKAKAGRMCNHVTLRCVELCGSLGYGTDELLEKFARDSKILDIFEGTQQIQQLIIARRVLGKTSRELT